jgi:DNA primase
MSEVVGKRVSLKKHGREYQGLCPFHKEKTPSFTVNNEKNFFHCFGCGAHGDAIEFVRRFEKLSYAETIESLARDAGIPLPEVSPEQARKAEVEKTLYDVLEAATQWFERQLMGSAGTVARDYLEKRGLKSETIRTFRAGFAPDERTALNQYLLTAGFTQALQAEAGLIIVPETGPAYDRFRGRVMFPIRNANGRVVAFGGRLIASNTHNKSLPKYLNSPETPVFRKGELLYNLDLAKKSARDGNVVVVMEGYMDVVSTAQAGVPYAVATLGTAVTPEHLRLLWQLAKEPVICLDGDEAGKRAMMRAAEVALPLLKPGYSLRFARLPLGEDPDSYIQKNGKTSFEKILLTSRRLSQVLWEDLSPQYNTELPEGRAELENILKNLAEKIPDTTVKQHYLSYFRRQLWSRPLKSPLPGKTAAPARATAQERSPQVEHLINRNHSVALEMLVQRLLTILLKFPQLLHKSHVEETLSRLDIQSNSLSALRNAMIAAITQSNIDHPEQFVAYLEQSFHGSLPIPTSGNGLKLPYANTLTGDDAALLWSETVSAYEVAHLQFEIEEVQESLGQSMNEASLQRLTELQQALWKAQDNRQFARSEPDMA